MAMALPPSPQQTPSPQPTSTPSTATAPKAVDIRTHNPIPLTASQEAQVRELYYKRVRDKCANEIREFAHCATGRTFSIPFVCRKQRLAMNGCMIGYATREEEDRAREEWFQKIPERQAEHEQNEKWKEQERKKHREWWGLDEQGRRIIQPPPGPKQEHERR